MFYDILRGKEKFSKQMRLEYSYSGSYSEMVTHCFQPKSLHGLSPVLFSYRQNNKGYSVKFSQGLNNESISFSFSVGESPT